MAKRRVKKRTHAKALEEELAKIPRLMVVRAGSTLKNPLLTQLVRDFRVAMQPHTAIRLQERRSNHLKDYVVMCGPLGVLHLMVFSQSERGSTHLRMARTPNGPTLTFKVHLYLLCADVARFQRHPKLLSGTSPECITPPLLVLNGFTNPNVAEPWEKVLVTVLQNMFPPILPQLTKVLGIKRVLMVNKDPETGEMDLRHYVIDTRLVDVLRKVKRLLGAKTHLHKRLPNLGAAGDVSDLLLDPHAGGYTSELEQEDDAVVEIGQEATVLVKRQKVADEVPATKKRAVRLTEVGPRMHLELVKIEEGVCKGKVLYHSRVQKGTLEAAALEARHAEKVRQKAARRAEQEANVKAKRAKKDRRKERRAAAKEAGAGGADSEGGEDSEDDALDSDGVQIAPEDYDEVSDLYSE